MRTFTRTLSGTVLGLCGVIGIGNAANFSDPSIGISIDLDDEFVEQTQWHGYRIFRTPDNAASVFIKPVHDLDLYDLKKELEDGGWYDDNIDLNVIGAEKAAGISYGSGVLVPVRGRVGEYKVQGVFGAFSGFGDQDFIVVGAARPDYWDERKPDIRAMFDSIRFIEIDYAEMLANWERRLTGKSLAPQNPVARGPRVPKPINLCSDGTVANEKPAGTPPAVTAPQQTAWNGAAWVTVPAAPLPPRSPGRWHIAPIRGEPILVIRHGRRPQEFRLEMAGDQLLVNGKPYDITENTLCR